MLVVSDTTPLNYLILIRAEHVLPDLYGSVLVPLRVIDELMHEDTPQPVRVWANNLPDWVHVREGDTSRFPLLDPGEAAALALALETHADLLLADDAEARLTARFVGVPAIGTLAEAHNASLLDYDASIEVLRSTTFRAHDGIIAAVRERIQRHERGTL